MNKSGQGRKKRPAAEHATRGTWRKDRHGATVSVPIKMEPPACPDYLKTHDRLASGTWAVVCGRLQSDGVDLTATELPLELFVATYLEYRSALKLSKGEDCVIESDLADGRTERRRNPVMVALHQYRDQLLGIATELGMTPSGRARLLSQLSERDKSITGRVAARARE